MKQLEQTTAGEVMSDVVTARGSDTLRSVAELMRHRDVHCLVVPPERTGQGTGVLTTKDVVSAVLHEGAEALDELTVADVVTRPAVSVQADLCLADCFHLMRHTGVRRVPVQRGSQVVGLLGYTDLLAFIVAQDRVPV